MKTFYLIAAAFAAISAVDSATIVSQQTGTTGFGRGLKSNSSLAADPASEEGWIEVTTVAKLWPDSSAFPKFIQLFFACSWILMMAALPFILPMWDNKAVTRTQKMVGAAMLAVLFGGLYLFTNIILFQSVHFKQIRPLTIIECIYLMSQVITTVGYGDITPAKPRGQVFIALYVLGALFVIAMLVSQVVEHCTNILHKKRVEMWGKQETPRGKAPSVHELLHPDKPSLKGLLASFLGFLAIDIIWILFFSLFPGENKTAFEAFYMSLVTLTTVGFGAITPLTEEGMIFAAFFMLVGSAAIVNVITNFCEFVHKMNEFQRFSPDVKKEAMADLKNLAAGREKVSEFEFFRFVALYQNLVTEEEIDAIRAVFMGMSPQNGYVDYSAIEDSGELEKARSQYFEKECSITGSVSRHIP